MPMGYISTHASVTVNNTTIPQVTCKGQPVQTISAIAASSTIATPATIITRDYNGLSFQFREDGFFNMTKAAKHFGKHIRHFWANESTDEYLDELQKLSGNPEGLVQTTMGRNGGTWAHPKLAVFFARWLDVKFAVWCDMVIDDLLRGKAEVTITKPEESAVMALPKDFSSALRALADAVEQQEKLKEQNAAQAKEIEHLASLMTSNNFLTTQGLTVSQATLLCYLLTSRTVVLGYCAIGFDVVCKQA